MNRSKIISFFVDILNLMVIMPSKAQGFIFESRLDLECVLFAIVLAQHLFGNLTRSRFRQFIEKDNEFGGLV